MSQLARKKDTQQTRPTMASTSAYTCIAGKCSHRSESQDCWATRFSNAMASIGDPALLDDKELLSALFTVPPKVDINMSTFSNSTSSGGGAVMPTAADIYNTFGLFLVESSEVPDPDVYHAAVVLVYAAIGVRVVLDLKDRGVLRAIHPSSDYGNSIQASLASDARVNWLRRSGRDDKGKDADRSRAVLSIMISMVTRGMESWAMELFVTITEEHSALRRIKKIKDAEDAKQLLSNTKMGASVFPKIMGLMRRYTDRIYERNRPHHSEDSEDHCGCGISWLRVAEYGNDKVSVVNGEENNNEEEEEDTEPTKMYMVCPLKVTSGSGCSRNKEYSF